MQASAEAHGEHSWASSGPPLSVPRPSAPGASPAPPGASPRLVPRAWLLCLLGRVGSPWVAPSSSPLAPLPSPSPPLFPLAPHFRFVARAASGSTSLLSRTAGCVLAGYGSGTCSCTSDPGTSGHQGLPLPHRRGTRCLEWRRSHHLHRQHLQDRSGCAPPTQEHRAHYFLVLESGGQVESQQAIRGLPRYSPALCGGGFPGDCYIGGICRRQEPGRRGSGPGLLRLLSRLPSGTSD